MVGNTVMRYVMVAIAFGSVLSAQVGSASPVPGRTPDPTGQLGATLTPEIDEPDVDEYSVDAAPGLIVWTQATNDETDPSDAYLRVGSGEPVQVDLPGTEVSFVATDGATIVLSEASAEGDLDLVFMDVATQTRFAAPEGVNTPRNEDWPSLDGDWLFFQRTKGAGDESAPGRILGVLFNRQTGEERVLVDLPARDSQLFVGQVEGDFAAWSTCYTDFDTFTVNDCQVFRYRISTQETVRVPNPHKQQFAPLVTADGTVYFTRNRRNAAWACGEAVKVMRYPLGGPVAKIATVPDGFGAFWGHAVVESDGSTTLHFYRPNCQDFTGGIYRLDDADSL